MSIVQIGSTLRNAPAVGVQSCIYGIECEVVKAEDPDNIVFELSGNDEKISIIIRKTNSRMISSVTRQPLRA
jgi:hypothetical protein